NGNPLISEKVRFSLFQGGGEFVTSTSVLTDAKGHAYALFKADNTTGLHIVRANATEIGKIVNFSFIIQTERTIQLVKMSEDGLIKRPLQKDTLTVRALDAFSRNLSDEYIAFTIAEGGGSIVESQPVSTNEDGMASATWILGIGSTQKVSVKPFDAAGDSVTFSATVINHAPVLSHIPHDTTTTVGKPLTMQISATDADGDTVTFSVINLPQGAVFNTTVSPAEFSWTPSESRTEPYPIIFIATDDYAAADSDTVNVTVYPAGGQCPIITATVPGDTTREYPPDTTVTFTVIASDPLGEDLKYSWKTNAGELGIHERILRDLQLTAGLFGGDSGYVAVTVSNAVCDITVRWHIKLVPTSVELSNFQAAPGVGGIQLDWQTRSENSNVGFNVLRSEKTNGAYKRINATILPPRSDGSYHFVDENAQAGVTYYYKLQDVDRSGAITEHGPVSAALALPDKLSLAQNYPNPFNPTTTITFELPQSQQVRLVIYNLSGQIIRTLVNETVRAGVHKVVWTATAENGATVPSGIYYYRLTAGDKVFTKKLLLLK
ncbi:MAG: T9SS type A sorting domain-containing protein, partial [Calditrichaeota bacterium]|nr:T9SS type A sorting domain-containing protein [Calditrichota bacterium]